MIVKYKNTDRFSTFSNFLTKKQNGQQCYSKEESAATLLNDKNLAILLHMRKLGKLSEKEKSRQLCSNNKKARQS